MRVLPSIVCKLAYGHEAWIVGSAAHPNIDVMSQRDVDVMVPYSHWQSASLLIPSHAKTNTFGGWKFDDNGVEVDVWPAELSWLMVNKAANWAWHPRSDTRIHKYTPTT